MYNIKVDLEVGDSVVHSLISTGSSREVELIRSLEHETHGIKGWDEDYCYINKEYWAYDDISEIIRKNGDCIVFINNKPYLRGIDEYKK